jgi:hypothetical protein
LFNKPRSNQFHKIFSKELFSKETSKKIKIDIKKHNNKELVEIIPHPFSPIFLPYPQHVTQLIKGKITISKYIKIKKPLLSVKRELRG